MTKDEALRLALGALIEVRDANIHGLTLTQDYHEAITAIKAALEAKDEPQYVAFMDTPQRTWVGLTDEEIEDFVSALWPVGAGAGKLLRAVEAKLKEKNT